MYYLGTYKKTIGVVKGKYKIQKHVHKNPRQKSNCNEPIIIVWYINKNNIGIFDTSIISKRLF